MAYKKTMKKQKKSYDSVDQNDGLLNKKKKSGGFQSMGLSWQILKGVLNNNYKVPTPIQRKTIPEILLGKDVVAMARTGNILCFNKLN
jgi:ATP-dependent RNA helicase DDX54/DBP10